MYWRNCQCQYHQQVLFNVDIYYLSFFDLYTLVVFTIAAAIANTAATVFAWLTYNQAYNPINSALIGLMTIPSGSFLHEMIEKI